MTDDRSTGRSSAADEATDGFVDVTDNVTSCRPCLRTSPQRAVCNGSTEDSEPNLNDSLKWYIHVKNHQANADMINR
ncbi:MAG: hypothetical protein OXI96_06990 [Acidimicrobiaceae bacterium]|nr:hypothetical protein [Acidimicrobiaceae bacterium]